MFSQALEICAQCDTYGCVVVANALTAVFVGSHVGDLPPPHSGVLPFSVPLLQLHSHMTMVAQRMQ